jgi:hypothetical protein
MAIRDEIESALEELENDSGATQKLILPSGAEIPCVPGMLSDADRLIEGGFESAARCVVLVRCGNFVTADMTTITVDSDLFTADNNTPRPHASKRCEFRGQAMRVLVSAEDASRAYLRLTLGPDHI